jgi:acyl-coenzyme A synthetase/AMP-(fatty) acid ligase
MFEALAQLMGDGRGAGSLRLAYSAGGPMPLPVEARFRAAAGMGIGQLYGATELGLVTFSHPAATGFDPASVGAPVMGVSIRILDPDEPNPDRPLSPDAEGHVAVAAPSMLSGYLSAQSPIVGGHFLTGDLGRLDPQGRLFLTGRLKLFIDVGGLKVNPAEVERVLLAYPGVKECIVVPIRVSDTVERIRAVLVPAAGAAPGALSPESLRRFAQERLAPHKVPRVFEIRPALPRSPTGKILRRELEAK